MRDWDQESIDGNLAELVETQRWEGFEAYLQGVLDKNIAEILDCRDDKIIFRLQGKCLILNELLQLRKNFTIL